MVKRVFDLFFSIVLLLFLGWVIFVFWVLAAIDTKSSGIFLQKRIGQFGKPFLIFKLKTMKEQDAEKIISSFGKFLRKSKIDETPQLLNVFLGTMSFVGPRPDIEGYYDLLEGEKRKILELKPGITSEASLKYTNEETILNQKENPKEYNDLVLFPDKVRMNLEYYYSKSLFLDISIIFKTLLNLFSKKA